MESSKTGPAHALSNLVMFYFGLLAIALMLFPSNLVIEGPLRSNGSLAKLIAFGLGPLIAVSVLARLFGSKIAPPKYPLHYAVPFLTFFGIAVLAYAKGFTRTLESQESSGATRNLLVYLVAILIAIALLEFTTRRDQVEFLCKVLVTGGLASAVVAVAQFLGVNSYVSIVRPPGFVLNSAIGVGQRSDINRVMGTAIHPIEFSVVTAALVPLAFYLVTRARSRIAKTWWIASICVLVGVLPLGISRSGVVALSVSLGVYAISWTWRQRLTAIFIAGGTLIVYRVVQPGVFSALVGLFKNASSDDSITGRTDDYPAIYALFDKDWILGIGLGTFRPDVYFFLDNQYLLTLVQQGALGVLALFVLLIAPGVNLGRIKRIGSAPDIVLLGRALLAGIAGIAVCGFTFDLESFPQSFYLMLILMGLVAKLAALSSETRHELFQTVLPERSK